MVHIIDYLKCKMVIDELMKKIEEDRRIVLKTELELMLKLKSLYTNEIIKWSCRENSSCVKISSIRRELRRLR